MPKTVQIVAVACGDVHLCHTPPVFRRNEPDWYAAMERPLTQIRSLSEAHDNCPILYAGDIFDRWYNPPELVNWAIEHLPPGWAVPGQHDLPNHNYREIHRSSYQTLVHANVLKNVEGSRVIDKKRNIRVYGFPWGSELVPAFDFDPDNKTGLMIALVHRFCWIRNNPIHPTDNKTGNAKRITAKLSGYDLCIFGDNHHSEPPVTYTNGLNVDQTVFNCGTLMRRRSNESLLFPQAGLVTADGDVIPVRLDTSADVYNKTAEDEEESGQLGLLEFLTDMKALGDGSIDFREALGNFFRSNPIGKSIRNIINEAIDGHD